MSDYVHPDETYRPYSVSYYVRSMAQLGIMVFVLMLCVDMGYAQSQQHVLQSTANMAAFLGARELPNTDNAAKAAGTYLRSEGVVHPESNIAVVGDAMVTVELQETYPTMFAKWLGVKNVPLRAYAQEQKL